jgi:predicted  nucleic acid-binding Zn-ribbon protein
MAWRPQRRIGRSNEERRNAVRELERQWEAEQHRHKQTVEQLRRARALLEERLSRSHEQRRAEEQIRDAYHDSRARVVTIARKKGC